MNLKDFRRRNEIIREGYFRNCDHLPTKLTEHPYIYCVGLPQNNRRKWRYPYTTARHDEVRVYSKEECSCIGNEIFPAYRGHCDFWQCNPTPLKKKDAKQQALFARKYGKMSYMRRYILDKNKIHIAKSNKCMKILGWDK